MNDREVSASRHGTRVERRRELIALATRRVRPGSGSGSATLARRTTRLIWPDLRRTLGDIPWAVCGAVATRLYMPERATAHLDIVILTKDASAVNGRLSVHGYSRQSDLTSGGSTWQSPDGRDVDVIERGDPWVADALAEAAANLDAQGLPVLPLRYLVVMKLDASRAQDLADLTRMLGAADEYELDQVRRTIRDLIPADRDDLEALIRLGRLERE